MKNNIEKSLRSVVITGASAGIGAEIAREVAPFCQEIVLVARRQEPLLSLAEELTARYGVVAHVLVADLSLPGAPENLWKSILDASRQPIDLFVNNAGFGLYGCIVDTLLEREKEMVELNVQAVMVLSKLAATDMVKRNRGHILNLASVAAFQPGPGMAVYFASKAFVLSYTEALDCELRVHGVRATALCPGSTETAFHETAGTVRVKWMHRLVSATPKEVAKAGVRGVLRNERVVVPGWLNWMMIFAVRFLPRSWTTSLSQRVLKT